MSHGVTTRSANLTYSGESGGLNESNSDIFGTMVEFYANNANDAPRLHDRRGAVLDPTGTNDSARWTSPPGRRCRIAGRSNSRVDVHYSSASATTSSTCWPKAAAPSRSVGTQPDLQRDDGHRHRPRRRREIQYSALTVYMTSNTNYAGARVATLNAATDLFGAGSAQVAAVKAAWSAVSVN